MRLLERRRWIAGEHAKGTPDEPVRILVADDEWVNRDGAVQSLTFPVDPRDMEAVEAIRRELEPPPFRTAPGGGTGERGASMNAAGPPILEEPYPWKTRLYAISARHRSIGTCLSVPIRRRL